MLWSLISIHSKKIIKDSINCGNQHLAAKISRRTAIFCPRHSNSNVPYLNKLSGKNHFQVKVFHI